MMHMDKRAWFKLHEEFLALAQLSSVFLVLEIKILFFTCCFTRCMAVHCMQTLFLHLHLFLKIALGNCSSEEEPHHLVSDSSIYLFLHITKDLLLPSHDSSSNFKLLGQAIRLKTFRTMWTKEAMLIKLQMVYRGFTFLISISVSVVWVSPVLLFCVLTLYVSILETQKLSEFFQSVTKALAELLNVYI